MKLKNEFGIMWNNRGIRGFSFLYAFFLIAGFILLITLQHGDVLLFINKYSRAEWDHGIDVISHIGHGSFIVILWFVTGFIKLRYALMGIINLGVVGIFTGVMKRFFFEGNLRPLSYFAHDDFYRIVNSSESNHLNGFPSGHAMAIFAAAFLLAYFIGTYRAGIILFFVALVVGFSRIYLLQHFFVDVYTGAAIGVISSGLTIWICDNLLTFNQKAVFQKPFLKFIRNESRVTSRD